MKTIVASHNPDLTRDFDRELLRRSDLRLVTARDTADLLARLREGADLCFLDRLLPDGDATQALAAMRAEPKLAHIPAVLVLGAGAPGSGDANEGRRAAAGFADVVELPAAPGTLSLLVSRLVGLPLRSEERFSVRVHVFSSWRPADAESHIGTSVDLSERGMLLRTRRPAAVGSELSVRFALPGLAGELALTGRVVRVDERTFAPAVGLALSFVDLDARDRAALSEYLSVLIAGRPFRWRSVAEERRTVLELSGALDANSDLAQLGRGGGDLWLCLRELRRFSSDGVQVWIDFVRALPAERKVRLLECSVAFIHRANMVPNLLERQELVSLYAPYACSACGLEEERLLDVERDLDRGRKAPPAMTCAGCGGPLAFDEIRDQYFAFFGR